jgi:hypothetical protein
VTESLFSLLALLIVLSVFFSLLSLAGPTLADSGNTGAGMLEEEEEEEEEEGGGGWRGGGGAGKRKGL